MQTETNTCQKCDSIKQKLDKCVDDDQRSELIEETEVHHTKLAREKLKLESEY